MSRLSQCSAVVLGVAAMVLIAGNAHADVAVFSGPAYSQNFDSLAAIGTANAATPTGWTFYETGTNANGTYAAGAGTNDNGNSYSFGTGGSTERAMGAVRSGSLLSTIFFQFTNGNAEAITSLAVSYVGEQWRLGELERPDSLVFEYSTDATGFTDGSYTSLLDLRFTAPTVSGPVGARDGNDAAYRTALSGTISGLNVAPGQMVTFRWSDTNAAGADDGLAVDDFTLALTAVPEPSAWALMIGGFGAAGAMLRRRGGQVAA